MTTLSVIVITKNEEHNIRRCLQSVRWADEIIIIDSGSTDKTIDICREFTDKIYSMDWPGYGKQKQRALEKSTGDWVLSIDADETVSPELRKFIQNKIHKSNIGGYHIKVQLVFYGKKIKYAVGSDYHLRLFKRSETHFTEHDVHEKVIVSSHIEKLSSSYAIYHYSFRDVQQLLEKLNKYSSLSAEQKIKSNKKQSFSRGLFSSLLIFLRIYILNGGFLDGKRGFVLAFSFAEGAYYRYVKSYFMSQDNCHE